MAAKTPGGEMVVDVLIKTGANVDVAKRVSVFQRAPRGSAHAQIIFKFT